MTGRQSASGLRQFMALSIVSCMGLRQWAHSVSTVTDTFPCLNRPCTKGVAKASTAQAAYKLSPELKVIRWGVFSTVTG
jgi:hypothetical protein